MVCLLAFHYLQLEFIYKYDQKYECPQKAIFLGHGEDIELSSLGHAASVNKQMPSRTACFYTTYSK